MITYWVPKLYRVIKLQLQEVFDENFSCVITKDDDFVGYTLSFYDDSIRTGAIVISKDYLIPGDSLEVNIIKEDNNFKVKDLQGTTILDLEELAAGVKNENLKGPIKGFYFICYGLDCFECCNGLYRKDLLDNISSFNYHFLKHFNVSEDDSLLKKLIDAFVLDLEMLEDDVDFCLFRYEKIIKKAIADSDNLYDAIFEACYHIMQTDAKIKPLHRLFACAVSTDLLMVFKKIEKEQDDV